jgi:repressor LexA
MEFKDIIKNRRKELDLTLEEIGNAVGVAKATVLRWESGEIQNIRRDKIAALANILRLPVGVLMGWDNEEISKLKKPAVTTDTVILPVIGNIAAGYDEIAIEDWSGETVEVPASYLKGRNKNEFIVLKVHGDSMFPEYHDGDKVVILKQASLARSGSIGAILYDGETATLKRVEYFEDKIKLIPLNPTYPPKTISGPDCESVRIIGIPKVLIRDIEE